MNFPNLQQLTEANTISDALDGFEPSTPEGKKIWKLVQKAAKRKIANMTREQVKSYLTAVAGNDANSIVAVLDLSVEIDRFLKARNRSIAPANTSRSPMDKHNQELKALEDKFIVPFAKKHGLVLRGYLLRPDDIDPDRPSKVFDLRRNGLDKATFDEWRALAPAVAQKAQKLEDAYIAKLRSRQLRSDASDEKVHGRVASAMKKEDLQLDEAKKPKVEDDTVFNGSADEARHVQLGQEATVLAFLKDCGAKCRADVKKKLDKMVAKDEAAAKK